MRKPTTMTSTLRLCISVLAATALLAGCASQHAVSNTQYDFGPALAGQAPASAPMPALVVTDVSGSAMLDSQSMVYRLNYADPLQARAYASNRWASAPLQLLTQRLRSRFAQAGVKVLASTDASLGVPLMRIEADEFTHSFDSPSKSSGLVILRVSLFQGHQLLDQRSFSANVAATSADAAGGARALAASSDAIAADILAWLATMPARKE